MTLDEINTLLDEFEYCDALITNIESKYFGDYVSIIFESDEDLDVELNFLNCYEVHISHYKDYGKPGPYKNLKKIQMPFYIQSIKAKEDNGMFLFEICAFPLDINISCKDLSKRYIYK